MHLSIIRYVKENYNTHPFPAELKHGPERFKALNEYFNTHVSDEEKQVGNLVCCRIF